MGRDGLPFITDRSPARPPALPGTWDAIRLEMRNKTLTQGTWEGQLSAVLRAVCRGGINGPANTAAKAKGRGTSEPLEFLLRWLRHSRLAWAIDEAADHLVLTHRQPPERKGAAVEDRRSCDGGVEVGLFGPSD